MIFVFEHDEVLRYEGICVRQRKYHREESVEKENENEDSAFHPKVNKEQVRYVYSDACILDTVMAATHSERTARQRKQENRQDNPSTQRHPPDSSDQVLVDKMTG